MTGAARGIGAAIASRLRADGMDVLTLDRDEGCDLRVDLVRDDVPPLDDVDVCVSNAAITDTVAPAHRMTAEQWERDLAVNLSGAFRAVQACLAGMRVAQDPVDKAKALRDKSGGSTLQVVAPQAAIAGEGDRFDNFIPHLENIGYVTIELFRPKMTVGRRLDQLHVHRDLISFAQH